MQTIQSQNVPIWLSADGVAYKQLVCIENYSIPLATQNTKTATFCGTALGLGITEFTVTVSAVCEAAPTAGQVTYADLIAWQLANQLISFKVQYPSPGSTNTNVFLSGQCAVTDTTLTGAVNDALKFSTTLTGTGTIDNTP